MRVGVSDQSAKRGQVAQVVERSPEKAGVGGSTPSLATILFKNLAHFRKNSSVACGPFLMFMRLFWPKPEALDGEWKQPTLHQTRLRGHDPQLRKSGRQVEN
jgi:hypothetical protein